MEWKLFRTWSQSLKLWSKLEPEPKINNFGSTTRLFRTLSEVTLHKFGGLTSDKRIFGAGIRSNFLSGRLKNLNNNVKKQNEREPEFRNSMAKNIW